MSINVCNDRSMASITSLPSGVTGSSLVLISEQTASSSSTISFTSGIDSTYKEYVFKFIDIHPSADVAFKFNFSADGGSNYNVTKTSSMFRAYHSEGGGNGVLQYLTAEDLAQSTSPDFLHAGYGSDTDNSCAGTLHLFDPASTTFVKHYIANVTGVENSSTDLCNVYYKGGYCNTTSAINAVQFSNASGNIDSGTFKLYGVV